jgi:hypothetical protein
MVAWGVLCRVRLPSPFFSVITGCVERGYSLLVFGQVRGEERESIGKNLFKNLLLPLLHIQGRKKNSAA